MNAEARIAAILDELDYLGFGGDITEGMRDYAEGGPEWEAFNRWPRFGLISYVAALRRDVSAEPDPDYPEDLEAALALIDEYADILREMGIR